jgi:hypothetical protein
MTINLNYLRNSVYEGLTYGIYVSPFEQPTPLRFQCITKSISIECDFYVDNRFSSYQRMFLFLNDHIKKSLKDKR